MSARVIIAIAGMEGALASVIGGLADCPVIAVPTSIGYGASFHGVSALLSMLNSCWPASLAAWRTARSLQFPPALATAPHFTASQPCFPC